MIVYSVYMISSPEGKKYIGMTMKKPAYRWRKGKGYENNKELYADILKFGWDSFDKTIIASGLTKEEAEQTEVENIRRYKTQDPAYGYNHEMGGMHPKIQAESTKRKNSLSHIGLPRSKEHCKHISKSKMGAQNGMFGMYGGLNPNATKVIATATDGNETTYDSISSACRILKLSKNAFKNISAACKGKRRSAYGFTWRYADDY